ncbi:MAG: hypothetical protein RL095_970 [Verrucomicrobiota bacterium]|jgi:hypothetical protein
MSVLRKIDLDFSRPSKWAGCVIPFGLAFLLAGSALIWEILLHPGLQRLVSSSWTAIPCQIVRSELVKKPGHDSWMIARLVYAYEFKGRKLSGSRIDFQSELIGLGGAGEAQNLIAEYPLGKNTVCFIHPGDPSQAVLRRDWGAGAKWFVGGFGFLMALAGSAVSMQGLRPWRSVRRKENLPPVLLQPDRKSTGTWLAWLAGCLFWNGILLGLLICWILKIRDQGFAWTDALAFLFGAFFSVIGLGLLFAAIGASWDFLRPAVKLLIENGAVIKTGEPLRLRCIDVRQPVRLELICTEKAIWNDTRSHSDEEAEVMSISVGELSDDGELRFDVPFDLMPSFKSQCNFITWRLRLRSLEDAEKPALDDSYPVELIRGGSPCPS